jgi:cytochrome c553
MKKTTVVMSALVLCAASGLAMAGGDAAAGKAKAATCAGCHGAAGVSAVPMYPSLAGQKAQYMVKQMKDFKSGARKDPTMSAMAAPLSDADMENLAAFYAAQSCK